MLAISHFTYYAEWAPVFDVALTTGDAPTLRVDRAALISQQSGEDWTGVELVLATVERNKGATSETVYERLKSIRPKVVVEPAAAAIGAPAQSESMVTELLIIGPSFAFESNGLSTLYRFPRPVSLRSGEDELRLALNAMDFTPEIYAVSAPMYEGTQAFVTADFTNTSDEPLVSKMIRSFLDGVLVGRDEMDPVPAGGVATVGFGPVQGLSVKRTVTKKSQGETGLIAVSNQSNELVQIDLNNLTGRDWPVRIQDQVPFSEQDDLKISYTATPPATTENLNKQRGVLEWRFDLPAGQTKTILLDTRMEWPEGMEVE